MAENPCTPVTRTADDGARVEGCAHGGHITGWWPGGARESRLWMSPSSRCGRGTAIRGGIPVVFPQFGVLGALPKHGFARDRAWHRREPAGSGGASLEFTTTIEGEPGWPHQAMLGLSATCHGNRLTVRLTVTNTGSTPFTFTAALHTYLRVSSTHDATVEGLSGRQAVDAMAGGRATTLPPGPLAAVGPTDLMVRDAPGSVVLRDPSTTDLTLAATGFRDYVVWNPGPGHGLADVRPGDENGFVCVEPAALDPVGLGPRQQWVGALSLTATADQVEIAPQRADPP